MPQYLVIPVGIDQPVRVDEGDAEQFTAVLRRLMADRTTVPAVARELDRSTAGGGIACLTVTVSVIAAGGDDGDSMSPKWHKRERRITHDNAWRNYDGPRWGSYDSRGP